MGIGDIAFLTNAWKVAKPSALFFNAQSVKQKFKQIIFGGKMTIEKNGECSL